MTNRWTIARVRAAAAICVVTLIAGCGGTDRATVWGTLLRKDGSPVVGARVIATSAGTGKSAYGHTDQNGAFELGVSKAGDGAPPGEYSVIILESRGDTDVRPPATISRKYQNRSTSGISFSLEAGDSKRLDLTLDPPP